MRAEAGKTIARETAVILWNEVGARGCQTGAGDFYTMQHVLQNFALLLGIGEDLAAWWLLDSDRRGKEHDERFHYYVLVEGHHKAHTESAVLLTESLRTVLASLLPDVPSGPAVLGMLQAGQRNLQRKSGDRSRCPKPRTSRMRWSGGATASWATRGAERQKDKRRGGA